MRRTILIIIKIIYFYYSELINNYPKMYRNDVDNVRCGIWYNSGRFLLIRIYWVFLDCFINLIDVHWCKFPLNMGNEPID